MNCNKQTCIERMLIPSQNKLSGHRRPASETPFEWRFAGGPMMARIFMFAALVFVAKRKCVEPINWKPSAELIVLSGLNIVSVTEILIIRYLFFSNIYF